MKGKKGEMEWVDYFILLYSEWRVEPIFSVIMAPLHY